MTDPSPIELGEGEALYLNADLPDEGWEARHIGKPGWCRPRSFNDTAVVVARRIQWTPKPGDRVVEANFGEKAKVLAVHERWLWVFPDLDGEPSQWLLRLCSPEPQS